MPDRPLPPRRPAARRPAAGGGLALRSSRGSWIAPLIAGLGLLSIYLLTLSRGLVGGDTPELITACHVVGIPHQPGYPLYVLLGRAVSLLPGMGAAVAVTLVSALAAAAAAGVLCRLITTAGVSAVPAVLLGLTAGLSVVTWSQAVVAEVYTLGLFLGLLALAFVDRWRRRDADRDLVLAAYVGGLAVSHQPLMSLCLPGVVGLVVVRIRQRRMSMRALGWAVAAFIVPFTLFALLPIRSSQDPAVDYAQIGSMGDFFYHALGVASRSELLSEGVEGVTSTFSLLGRVAWNGAGPLTPILVLAGLLGLVMLARHDRERLILFGVPVVLMIAFVFVYAIHDVENYLILPLWLLTLSAATLVARFQRSGPRAPWARGPLLVGLLTLGLATGAFWANRATCDRSRYHLVDDFVANVLDGIPPGAALFLFTETQYGPFLYHREIEGVRTDVALVDMTGKVGAQPYGFRGLTGNWRERRWRRMESLHRDAPPRLDGRRFFALMYAPQRPGEAGLAYRRSRLAHELTQVGVPDDREWTYWDQLTLRAPHPDQIAADRTGFWLTPVILRLTTNAGLAAAEAALASDPLAAGRIYRSILELSPAATAARTGLALVHARRGDLPAAEAELRSAVEREPGSAPALNALAVILLQQGRRDASIEVFRQALTHDPDLALARLNLGLLLAEVPTSHAEAVTHLDAYLRLEPGGADAPRVREMIATLRRGRGRD